MSEDDFIRLGDELFAPAMLAARLRRKDSDVTDLLVRVLRQESSAQARDSQALEVISLVLRGNIMRYLTRAQQLSAQAAQEVWNDTLLRIFLRADTYDPARSEFITWVFNQARYAALDHKRRIGRVLEAPSAQVTELATEDELPEPLANRERSALAKAMARLNPTQRLLLEMRYAQDLGPTEISRRLEGELTPEEVRVYVFRARRRLADLYSAEMGET